MATVLVWSLGSALTRPGFPSPQDTHDGEEEGRQVGNEGVSEGMARGSVCRENYGGPSLVGTVRLCGPSVPQMVLRLTAS